MENRSRADLEPAEVFVVGFRLPPALRPLVDVALNLRWTWDRRSQELFTRLDPDAWGFGARDPLRLLETCPAEHLESLAEDRVYTALLQEVSDDLARSLGERRWFQERDDSPLRSVAYFSPEFGIAEAIPQYSGGLGVLAGDHLKSASHLGLPLVGVGLLYRHGYFRQELDASGWQQERYPMLEPSAMALRAMDVGLVEVPLGDATVRARIWRADVGRIPLYLLDADIAENAPSERLLTDRLYGGGQEHRLRQELLLGIGGVRALDLLGIEPQVFHMNEGHAGFLALERIRRHVARDRLGFAEAVEAVRGGTVFTTHTSVPAGIDRFPRPLMERYLAPFALECGTDFNTLMSLGQEPQTPAGEAFNMAAMGLRLSGACNGVSLLHGGVSRSLFSGIWPALAPEEVPITSVTNGVHARSWVSDEMIELYERHLGPDWPIAPPERWRALREVPDDEIWEARRRGRENMVAFVRRRLRETGRSKRMTEWDLDWFDTVLDPEVLTIGFARRFAAYKRATLLLSDPERLEAMLTSEERPVQLLFAGKAHPADDHGKEMIRRIAEFTRRAPIRHRMVFVEDYDIAVGRALVQGCDLWLNTPRRPHEACGTSGMKAVLNAGLNCSVLDGWWDEMFDGRNGFAISSAEMYPDDSMRDEVEASGLFELLETRVIPLFYEREHGGMPRAWLERVKESLASLGPSVISSRMLREYVERLYEPAGARADSLAAEGWRRARSLAEYKSRARSAFSEVRIEIEPGADVTSAEVGNKRDVRCLVTLGSLQPGDVEVEVLHGPVDGEGHLHPLQRLTLTDSRRIGPGSYRYSGGYAPERAGPYGMTARVLATHPDLASHAELGLARWAEPAGPEA